MEQSMMLLWICWFWKGLDQKNSYGKPAPTLAPKRCEVTGCASCITRSPDFFFCEAFRANRCALLPVGLQFSPFWHMAVFLHDAWRGDGLKRASKNCCEMNKTIIQSNHRQKHGKANVMKSQKNDGNDVHELSKI